MYKLISSFLLLSIVNIAFSQTSFTNVSDSSGIDHYYSSTFDMGGGVAVFDFNNDDFEDIYYTGGKVKDALYKNNGDGTFTNITSTAGFDFTDSILTVGAVTADIDNDGFRDLLITTNAGHINHLMYNNGDETFTNISISAGFSLDSIWSFGASFGDYDSDGYLDLYIGNYVETPITLFDSLNNFIGFDHDCYANKLYKNNGDNTFTDLTSLMNLDEEGCNLAASFSDFDNDGDIDIVNANDFGEYILPNALYQNNFPNDFSNISNSSGFNAQMYGMGIAIGDYDQDMDLDYYVTNIGRCVLSKNNAGSFVDETDIAGVDNQWIIIDSLQHTSWGTSFLDINNDTYLDLFVSNGIIPALPELMTYLYDENKMYLNNGDGTFSDVSIATNLNSDAVARGFSYFDYDNDGDLDLLPVHVFIPMYIDTLNMPLYRNDLNNGNNWLKVKLEGTVSNRDAFGAHISIFLDDRSWIHEVDGGSSHASHVSSIAHFGLADKITIDSLIIDWPSGIRTKIEDIAANQILKIVEEEHTTTTPPDTTVTPIDTTMRLVNFDESSFSIYPNPAKEKIIISAENGFMKNIKLQLFNTIGQLIYELNEQFIDQNSSSLTLDISNFNDGIYLLKINENGKEFVQKVMIKHSK